jgi:hypothetical protein
LVLLTVSHWLRKYRLHPFKPEHLRKCSIVDPLDRVTAEHYSFEIEFVNGEIEAAKRLPPRGLG